MTLNRIYVSAHFMLEEFDSPDTQEVKLAPELVEKLEHLRSLVGKPIRVLSGYRTPEHNKAVGGVAGSYHMRGQAADVTWDGISATAAAALAERAEFDGIGTYPTQGFIHVDVRGYRARWSG